MKRLLGKLLRYLRVPWWVWVISLPVSAFVARGIWELNPVGSRFLTFWGIVLPTLALAPWIYRKRFGGK